MPIIERTGVYSTVVAAACAYLNIRLYCESFATLPNFDSYLVSIGWVFFNLLYGDGLRNPREANLEANIVTVHLCEEKGRKCH